MAWFEIDWGGEPPPRGVLVCDATAAAALMWGGPLLSVLEDFAAGPAAGHPDVVFLGGNVAHPLAEVLRRAADLDRLAGEELNRGPALGPWAASETPRPTVVALLAGTQPVDLEDYATPAWRANLRLFRFLGGDTPNPAGVPEFGPDDLAAAVEFLADTPTGLTVSGPGGVFLDWSPDADAGWDRLTWAAPPWPPAAGPLRVEFHHPDGDAPAATVARKLRAARAARVTPADAPPAEPPVPLPAAADTLLGLWGRGLAWSCDLCHAAHAPGVAACATGGGSLLPALPRGRLWSVRSRAGVRAAHPAARGRLVTAAGDTLRHGPRGVECRRADGATDAAPALFVKDDRGGHAVVT